MKREQAIEIILNRIHKNDVVIATTGKTGRELFELREQLGGETAERQFYRQNRHAQDFLNIGAMGHASMLALGIALGQPKRTVWCLDGDGALLMHMGSLAIIGAYGQTSKVRHIVLNNGAHDSVGGQPTVGFAIDMPTIARACGYRVVARAASEKELARALKKCARIKGPVFIEIVIKKGSRENLGRPTIAPQKAKIAFMRFVRS